MIRYYDSYTSKEAFYLTNKADYYLFKILKPSYINIRKNNQEYSFISSSIGYNVLPRYGNWQYKRILVLQFH